MVRVPGEGEPASRVLEHLLSLRGQTIPTLASGAPNRILEVTGNRALVATGSSPEGSHVPIAMLEEAYQKLARHGELEISVDTVGHRSSFVGAFLATMPGVTSATNPRRVRLQSHEGTNAAGLPASRPAGWIFQASPDLWDLESALLELSKMRWLVKQHREKVRPGDPVFMWVSGRDAGLVATAIVLTLPAQLDEDPASRRFRKSREKFEGLQPRVELEISRVLSTRIERRRLQATPGLENLSILRSAMGTNFPVRAAEAGILVRLCREATSISDRPIGPESWPEFASSEPNFVREAYEASSGNRRDLLCFLAERPDERMTYREVGEGLGWERKTLAPVLAGQAAWSKARANHRRPFHIVEPKDSKSGEWEMWMDRAASSVVREMSVR